MIFSKKTYKKRISLALTALPSGSSLLIPSWPINFRPGQIAIPYRQNSDLLYLCGFEEENSFLVLLKEAHLLGQIFLFVQSKDPEKELWSGPIMGTKKTALHFPIDRSYPIKDLEAICFTLLKDKHSIYYNWGLNSPFNKTITSLALKLKQKNQLFISFHDSTQIIAPLRMKKEGKEIKLIREATKISALSHIEVMRHTRPGLTENHLHGIFLSSSHKQGSYREAYPGIFATGKNACTLHYQKNNSPLQSGDLLLVDAGAEFNFYTSDITRTFPVNGRFSATQKRLYNKLLNIQKQLISFLKVGLSFSKIQNKAVLLITHLLLEEKLLSGKLKDLLKKSSYKKYFPHGFGHLMGLDVHDVYFDQSEKKKNLSLKIEKGFVLTIEPGLYIPPNDHLVSAELRGIGIRIEDDIYINSKGKPEVLSKRAPREIEDIEATMRSDKA